MNKVSKIIKKNSCKLLRLSQLVVKITLVPNWPRSNLKCFSLNHAKIFSSWFYTVYLLIMIMVIMVIWLDNTQNGKISTFYIFNPRVGPI